MCTPLNGAAQAGRWRHGIDSLDIAASGTNMLESSLLLYLSVRRTEAGAEELPIFGDA